MYKGSFWEILKIDFTWDTRSGYNDTAYFAARISVSSKILDKNISVIYPKGCDGMSSHAIFE